MNTKSQPPLLSLSAIDDTGLQTLARLDLEHPLAEPWEEIIPGLLHLTADGLKVTGNTSLRLYFRPLCQRALVVEADLSGPGDESFVCTVGGYSFSLGGAKTPGAKIALDRWPLAVTGTTRLTPGAHQVCCRRQDGSVALVLDGQVVLETADPRANESIPDLEYFLPGGVTIHKMVVTGKAATLPGIPRQRKSNYNLYMCIDFFDDLIAAPWTERTLRETLEIYTRHGIKRVYFIDHGGYDSGFWAHYDPSAYPIEKHGRETFENLGDILPAVVAAGHRAGLEVHAVYKPQEYGFPATYPYGSENARRYGRVPRLDGMMWWVMGFVAQHPEMRLERDLRALPEDLDARQIGSIVLTPEPGLNRHLDPQRLRLWVSPDNGGYRPYAGPLEIKTAASGTMVLDRLVIPEKFMAVTVEGEPTHAFGNVLRHLIAVQDQDGRRLPISYACLTQPRNLPLEKAGFMYDYPTDTVSEMDNYFWLDAGKPLGIAKGYERYVCGVLCEAYPEVQDEWLRLIDHYISAGVDGVDIRDLVHTRTFDWDAFGFNPPLVEAFKKRHGIDMLTEPFERADLRRLRGEFYFDFLRQARQRLRAAGKAMHLHLSPRMKSPEWHTELDVYQDWERWLREGLADEITLKMSGMTGEVAARAFALARELELPINFCPYMNGLPKHPHAKAVVDYLTRQALDTGMAGFIIYENAALLKARADGCMDVTEPWVLESLARYARG